jgi:hypothetical protein
MSNNLNISQAFNIANRQQLPDCWTMHKNESSGCVDLRKALPVDNLFRYLNEGFQNIGFFGKVHTAISNPARMIFNTPNANLECTANKITTGNITSTFESCSGKLEGTGHYFLDHLPGEDGKGEMWGEELREYRNNTLLNRRTFKDVGSLGEPQLGNRFVEGVLQRSRSEDAAWANLSKVGALIVSLILLTVIVRNKSCLYTTVTSAPKYVASWIPDRTRQNRIDSNPPNVAELNKEIIDKGPAPKSRCNFFPIFWPNKEKTA